jgi:hypothetical protein
VKATGSRNLRARAKRRVRNVGSVVPVVTAGASVAQHAAGTAGAATGMVLDTTGAGAASVQHAGAGAAHSWWRRRPNSPASAVGKKPLNRVTTARTVAKVQFLIT